MVTVQVKNKYYKRWGGDRNFRSYEDADEYMQHIVKMSKGKTQTRLKELMIKKRKERKSINPLSQSWIQKETNLFG